MQQLLALTTEQALPSVGTESALPGKVTGLPDAPPPSAALNTRTRGYNTQYPTINKLFDLHHTPTHKGKILEIYLYKIFKEQLCYIPRQAISHHIVSPLDVADY